MRWEKVFTNETSKICGRQLSKNFTWFILEYFVLDVLRGTALSEKSE